MKIFIFILACLCSKTVLGSGFNMPGDMPWVPFRSPRRSIPAVHRLPCEEPQSAMHFTGATHR